MGSNSNRWAVIAMMVVVLVMVVRLILMVYVVVVELCAWRVVVFVVGDVMVMIGRVSCVIQYDSSFVQVASGGSSSRSS